MSAITGPYNHMLFVDGLHWSPLPAWEFPEPTFAPPPLVTVATISQWEDEQEGGDIHQDVPEPAAFLLLALAIAVVVWRRHPAVG